jgi:hypothetical protein
VQVIENIALYLEKLINTYSLERLKHAFLPGPQSQSRQTYGYSFTPSEPEANSFRALFKDGHSRVYVTESESLFTVDPHTPSGNLFDFRF